ncbi:MAG: DUF4384 domain-containing protein [Deltaproteobacteria bacterium]|nr:DUF4384 domain-containing protein [Deltaproteobacteria bacterium]
MQRVSLISLVFALLLALTAVPVPGAERRALLIGINTYKNLPFKDPVSGREFFNLSGPVNDVTLMREMLSSQFAFRPGDIKVLLNEQATRAHILKTFEEWLIQGSKPGDLVFFYFSGHGTRVPDLDGDEADGFDEALCPHDFIPLARTVQETRTILDDELGVLLRRLSGREVVVFMDSCHAGDITRGWGGQVYSRMEPTAAIQSRFLPVNLPQVRGGSVRWQGKMQMEIPSGQIYLASCAAHQTAVEMNFGHGRGGAMTFAFLEALRGQHPTYRQLFERTRKIIKDDFRLPQDPELIPEKGELVERRVFVPAAAATLASKPEPSPPPTASPPPPAPSRPPEVKTQSVQLRLEALPGAAAAELDGLRRALAALSYVEVVQDGRFDRILKGEVRQGVFQVRLLNPLGDAAPLPPAKSGAELVQALAPHLEYAFIVKQLTQLRQPRPPFRVQLRVAGERRDFRLGDKIIYQVECERNCYILLLNLDSQGNFQVIFPNKYYQDNFVRAGTMEIPDAKMRRQDFEIKFGPPAGEETVKVIATTARLDLTKLGLSKFQELFPTLRCQALAPASPTRGLAKNIVSELVEKSKQEGFQWSEDTVVVRSHP